MVLVVMVGVSVHQDFQASQEAMDPRDQQVSRDHPAIMDLKDPWAHGETKAMKELEEDRDHQAMYWGDLFLSVSLFSVSFPALHVKYNSLSGRR